MYQLNNGYLSHRAPNHSTSHLLDLLCDPELLASSSGPCFYSFGKPRELDHSTGSCPRHGISESFITKSLWAFFFKQYRFKIVTTLAISFAFLWGPLGIGDSGEQGGRSLLSITRQR